VKTDLEKRIYQAQCIGNVEPIEYMIPYPSMRSLIEGQNIKFSEQVIIEDSSITNLKFYGLVQQTAHWLDSIGLKPRERIIISELEYPQAEILLYGIWHLGAIAVIPANMDVDRVKQKSDTSLLVDQGIDLFENIKDFPTKFEPKYKPLLNDEALVTFEKEQGIRLSHYNLLVNVNSIQKVLSIKSRTRYKSSLKPRSTGWVVFQAILPIYCGCIYDTVNPDFTIGETGNDFNLRYDLQNMSEFSKTDIAICPENSAGLSLEGLPVHLTDFSLKNGELKLQGHSVMMGYLDDSANKSSFRNKALYIPV
tara:strand:+ start:65 stop:988 length:924 start_codon:yes stop_codon:yes gene_type:complete